MADNLCVGISKTRWDAAFELFLRINPLQVTDVTLLLGNQGCNLIYVEFANSFTLQALNTHIERINTNDGFDDYGFNVNNASIRLARFTGDVEGVSKKAIVIALCVARLVRWSDVVDANTDITHIYDCVNSRNPSYLGQPEVVDLPKALINAWVNATYPVRLYE